MVNPALDYEKARPVLTDLVRRAHAHQLVSIEAVLDRLNACIKTPVATEPSTEVTEP